MPNGYKPPASVRETARNRFEPPPVRGDEESAMWEIKVGDRRFFTVGAAGWSRMWMGYLTCACGGWIVSRRSI